MNPPQFLVSVGRALLRASDHPGFQWDTTMDVAADIWSLWCQKVEPAEMPTELAGLAQLSLAEIRPLVSQILQDLKLAEGTERSRAISTYLSLIPGLIRKYCRRPSQPGGTSWPKKLSLESGRDLLPILPRRLPQLAPGDRPKDVGPWELHDLLDLGAFGEVWKAGNVQADGLPVALHFFSHAGAKEALRGPGAGVLDRVVLLGQRPDIATLQQVHLQAEPPCVQYAYIEAADLAGLVQEWIETESPANPLAVAQVIGQIAATLGNLHRLSQPLVHGNLRPASILVKQAGPDQWQCQVAQLGLGAWSGGSSTGFNPYASPQVLRGDTPQPRDDVFALGVLWYQLLMRNLDAPRPGGSAWRRKLTDLGVTQSMLELLESCFEDQPGDRPADALALAEKLGSPASTTAAPSAPEAGGRPRSRRADIRQLFDTLEQAAPERQKLLTNSTGIKLAHMPAGSFAMGSPEAELGRRINEGPQHEVALTRDFYMAVTPVTQKQFADVMGYNPAKFPAGQGGDLENPVEYVTWDEAVTFCQRLSSLPEENQARRRYRLPTEAEWEYACRAGTTAPFAFGASLGHGQANFDAQFPYGEGPRGLPLQKTTRVASFPANVYGLHDMHGNVWEWCADWLDSRYYQHSPRRDPQGPDKGEFRILRGGSWRNQAVTCRSAYRNGLPPVSRDKYTGFRVVMEMA